MATRTDEGWWPSTKGRVVTERVRLPDTFEVEAGPMVNLCLFWRRRDDDALGILASLHAVGRVVTVAHALAAAALLREIGEPGALRLAARLEKLAWSVPMTVSWRHDPMPASVSRRERPLMCTYYVDPQTKQRCGNRGDYMIQGARGSFCELHARRTVLRRSRQKKNAGTPTPTA